MSDLFEARGVVPVVGFEELATDWDAVFVDVPPIR